MTKNTLLLLTATAALWAQPLPPKPPPPPPPPDFHYLHDEFAGLHEKINLEVSAKIAGAMDKVHAKLPFAFAPAFAFNKSSGHERSYHQGLSALHGRRYEQALEAFSQAAMTAGARADGALYWKAFSLHRIGRRDEALAAIAELRKAHASSRWLPDAQSLEAAIKQDSGQKTAAQWDADEDLKVLALTGLIQSDPEKAAATVDQILKSSPFPRLKERAIQALSSSESQRSRDQLAQVARGAIGNPDLQLHAIRNLGSRRTDNRQLLRDIYNSTSDENVKRAVLRALNSSSAPEEVIRILKAEKQPSLRREAVSMLGKSVPSSELWPLYQSESSPEVKEALLHRLRDTGATERLLEIAKSDKEPNLRRAAIRSLGSVTTGDALVNLYTAESDAAMKRSIIDALHSHNNGKALVDLARKEKDLPLRREIVSRLARMRNSKEASGYMMEILK